MPRSSVPKSKLKGNSRDYISSGTAAVYIGTVIVQKIIFTYLNVAPTTVDVDFDVETKSVLSFMVPIYSEGGGGVVSSAVTDSPGWHSREAISP